MKPLISFDEDKLPNKRRLNGLITAIILVSVFVRGFLACYLELGNDEVYYWTYALYPDISHFDHPPMVGFIIQAFSFDLMYHNEFAIRLGSVILGAVNTLLMYLIGKKIRNTLTGLFAALLYNASVYCFVIAGIFILPDTPQVFFWIVSMYFLFISLSDNEIKKSSRLILFFAGIPVGLAMLSKYTSVFLWAGAILYILLYNRKWLKTSELYVSMLMSAMVFSPVILWNIENNWVSFTFQGERANFFDAGFRPDFFLTELFGQILYNNPVNIAIIVVALIAFFKRKFTFTQEYARLLLLTSLPLIGTFLFVSFFRRTLPHWTGPAYLSLILLSAVFLAEKAMKSEKAVLFPKPVILSLFLLMFFLAVGFFQVKLGIFTFPRHDDPKTLGKNDVTLDMFGWRQFSHKFHELYDHDVYSKNMSAAAPIISHRWFPAAHLDYYVALNRNIDLLTVGSLERVHKFAWINRYREPFRLGSDAWFITNSRDFQDPEPLLGSYFLYIEEPEMIKIFKGKKWVENFFVYRLRKCIRTLPDVLDEFGIRKPVDSTFYNMNDSIPESLRILNDSLSKNSVD